MGLLSSKSANKRSGPGAGVRESVSIRIRDFIMQTFVLASVRLSLLFSRVSHETVDFDYPSSASEVFSNAISDKIHMATVTFYALALLHM
jgi:hypothetical protein